MRHIKEDYVSFEVAKLLKEKGFKGQGEHFYEDNKITNYINYWFRITPKQRYEAIEAPTLQMAMKWLREIRKINIEIFTYWSIQEKAVYGNRIVSVEHHANVFKEIDIAYDTYEQACEAAIKYCLENLI